MSKAALLTAELLAALAQVPGVTGVYPQGEKVPDKAPRPYLLVRLTDSELEDAVGVSSPAAKRLAVYEVDAVHSRATTIQGFQESEHAILTALGFGKHQLNRPVKSGAIVEQSATLPDEEDGSTARALTVRLAYRYVETY